MEFHPIANIFPLLAGDEYLELVDNIRQHGLVEPICLYEGKILDGRNRYMACHTLGIHPFFIQWTGEGGSPIDYVLSKNLHRRHLDSSQRAACAVAALPHLEEEARKRMAAGGGDQKSGVELFPHPIEGQGKSRDEAAKQFGTNGRYVQEAKRLAEHEPELFEQVKRGELTIPKARAASQPVQVTTFSSESNEYYTPSQYIIAAREVLGRIDLDPASCEQAQRNVLAEQFYTEVDDGLTQEWYGTVWLNPPYGKTSGDSNQGLWAQKLIQEYRAGRVTEGILLVRAALGYEWFEDLWYAWPVCFARERVSFIKPDGSTDGPAKQGAAFFYLGPNFERFKAVFDGFGRIILPEYEETWRQAVTFA